MENTQIDITTNGTTTLATAGKYCARHIDVNVNVDVPVLFEVHKITISSDLTSGHNTLLSGSEFIRNNYTKTGFMLQLISLSTQQDRVAVAYAYNGNRFFLNNNDVNICGTLLRATASGSFETNTASGCARSNTNGVPYVNSSGDVLIYNNANNLALRAGNYLIVLAVANA